MLCYAEIAGRGIPSGHRGGWDGKEAEAFREDFWAAPPQLPEAVVFFRQEACVVPRGGPGGYDVYDCAEIRLGAMHLPVLVAYRAPLRPVDVPVMGERLRAVAEQLRQRDTGKIPPQPIRLPLIATDVASLRVLEVCERTGVALIDQRGTILASAPGAFIKVQGRAPATRRARVPLFRGPGCRIVRVLLHAPHEARSILRLSQLSDTPYAFAQRVVRKLLVEGYVEAVGSRAGVRLRDAEGLLTGWLASNERTAAAVEAFNAPSTTPELLHKAFEELKGQGARAIFTLASALLPEERFVSGLPHGIYLTGPIDAAVQAFGLRRMTPHNFWVLRAEPAAETAAGGVYQMPRQLPHGSGVTIPQAAVDLHHSGGRGKEQAAELLRMYARDVAAQIQRG
jgi:hypothetical protein